MDSFTVLFFVMVLVLLSVLAFQAVHLWRSRKQAAEPKRGTYR